MSHEENAEYIADWLSEAESTHHVMYNFGSLICG